jgi:hypothetical protein
MTEACFSQNSIVDLDHDRRDEIFDSCNYGFWRTFPTDANDPTAVRFEFESIVDQLPGGFPDGSQRNFFGTARLVDFDGDGNKDLFECSHGSVQYFLGLGDGIFDPTPRGVLSGEQAWDGCVNPRWSSDIPRHPLMADIDGDGADDVLLYSHGAGWARFIPNPGRGPEDAGARVEYLGPELDDERLSHSVQNDTVRFVDVNGDGLKDLYALIWDRHANPEHLQHPNDQYVPLLYVNRGGKFNAGNLAFYLSPHVDVRIHPRATPLSIRFSHVIDFNGDGFEDIIRPIDPRMDDPPGTVGLWLFDRAVLWPDSLFDASEAKLRPSFIPDVGAAAPELARIEPPLQDVSNRIIPGGTACSSDPQGACPRTWSTSTLADTDGDGSVDLVFLNEEGRLVVNYGEFGRENLLKSVTDGLGKKVTVQYDRSETFSDGVHPVYRRPVSCQPDGDDRPVSRCRTRMGPVVSQYRTLMRNTFPLGEIYRLRYEGARDGLGGRGWLGFDRRIVERILLDVGQEGPPQPILIQRTELSYHNTEYDAEHGFFPFAGLERERIVQSPFASSEIEVSSEFAERTTRRNAWTL